MTDKVKDLAAKAAQEIRMKLAPGDSPHLKKLYELVGGEPLYDPLGYYIGGQLEFRDSALDSCEILKTVDY